MTDTDDTPTPTALAILDELVNLYAELDRMATSMEESATIAIDAQHTAAATTNRAEAYRISAAAIRYVLIDRHTGRQALSQAIADIA